LFPNNLTWKPRYKYIEITWKPRYKYFTQSRQVGLLGVGDFSVIKFKKSDSNEKHDYRNFGFLR
jgi:hypothetical protein